MKIMTKMQVQWHNYYGMNIYIYVYMALAAQAARDKLIKHMFTPRASVSCQSELRHHEAVRRGAVTCCRMLKPRAMAIWENSSLSDDKKQRQNDWHRMRTCSS